MIDQNTRSRLKVIEKLSLTSGQDLFEALDRAGLLYTEERAAKSAIWALSSAIMQLEDLSAHTLTQLGGKQNTAQDARDGAIEFLKMVRSQFEKDLM